MDAETESDVPTSDAKPQEASSIFDPVITQRSVYYATDAIFEMGFVIMNSLPYGLGNAITEVSVYLEGNLLQLYVPNADGTSLIRVPNDVWTGYEVNGLVLYAFKSPVWFISSGASIHIYAEYTWLFFPGSADYYYSQAIVDDDTTPPSISANYYGGGTDGNPGYIEVHASDASGLVQDPTGGYAVSPILGTRTYWFTAVDADYDRPGDQLSSSIGKTVTIVDDDTTPPSITCTYYGSGTDGDPGFIQVVASDASGLAVDPSGPYSVSRELGSHTYYFTAKDADNDRPNDQLERTVSLTVTIVDDDTIPPTISWTYYGSYTDANPGFIHVVASDASGLAVNPSGNYPVLKDPGIYEYHFLAIDNDNDRPNDALSTTATAILEILDDDPEPPTIWWNYIGSYTDGDPGYIHVEASDNVGLAVDPSGDCSVPAEPGVYTFSFTAVDNDNDRPDDALGTTIPVEIEIVDDDTEAPTIDYTYTGSGTDGDPGFITVVASDASGLAVDPSGVYPVPAEPGIYSFTFTAVDADEDRPDDALGTTITVEIEIVDDDTEAPTISWIYSGGGTDGNPGLIHVVASDNVGLALDPSGEYPVPSDLGIHTFTFTAIDNDTDRPGDALSLTVTASIEITDDDASAPVLIVTLGGYALNPTGGIDLEFSVLAEDPESGIDPASIEVLVAGQRFTTLGTHIVNVPRAGTYILSASVKNMDLDRGAVDQEISAVTLQFEITQDDVKALLLEAIDAMIGAVQNSSDAAWRNPELNRKAEMVAKLGNLRVLCEMGNYARAYDLLLNDIKPKLTQLKTDEHEIPWANGVFNNPWVIDPLLQEEFRLMANAILYGIQMI